MNSSVLSLQPGVVSSDLPVADRIPRNSFRPEDMLFKDRGSAEADQFRELLLCQIEQTFARPGRQSGLPSAPDEECEQMVRSEEHTSELQSRGHLVCRLLLAKK